MSVKIEAMLETFRKWQDSLSDPLMDKYPLLEEPFTTLAITSTYLLVVNVGPKIMQDRKPYDVKTFNYLYNIFQVLFCAYFIVTTYFLTEIEPDGIYLYCKRWHRPDASPKAQHVRFLIYINFLTRILELSETLIHVLRKKNRQISTLHVTHHTMNVLFGWFAARTSPGGTALTFLMANYVVHFLMYSYYLAVTSNSHFLVNIGRKCKQYLTSIQIIQFFYMISIVFADHLLKDTCGSLSVEVSIAGLLVVFVNLVLFVHFYWVTYVKPRTKSA